MKYWNNGIICKRSKDSPGPEWNTGRLKFSRISPSTETREKIRTSNLGKCSPNKGKRGVSSETSYKMSVAAKARVARGIMPNTKGLIPWNKGKIKEDDSRILQYVKIQTGQLREGKYPKGENHWNWKDSDTYTKPFYHYSKEVWRLTRSNYNKNKEIINPNNLKRARAGIDGAHQLDHKVSVHFGFVNGIDPAEIADISNLQLLPWKENLIKSNK